MMSFSSLSQAEGLPDPLILSDGRQVTTPEVWTRERRPEILELFREHVYGRAPVGRPDELRFEITEPLREAFEGRALHQAVKIVYGGPGGEGVIPVSLYYPKTPARGCFVLVVNRSRRIITEAETAPNGFWPVEEIVARGYATAAFHNSDLAPDNKADGFRGGVFGVHGSPDQPRASDAWATIAAWAWGASRVVDYVETDPLLKDAPVAVVGHSRGGKTALWCGAQDERVDLTISNDSGTTGAALARTTRGETVARINEVFPHWFAENYKRYNNDVGTLPVDQHQLIAAIAPRLAYVASASEDSNADPRAEFQACVEAGPVYRLLGGQGVEPATFPEPGEARHEGRIGYHLRPGPHDLRPEDWSRFMDFSDRHWPVAAPQ